MGESPWRNLPDHLSLETAALNLGHDTHDHTPSKLFGAHAPMASKLSHDRQCPLTHDPSEASKLTYVCTFFLFRAAATCAEPRVVSKRLRCTGDRMCHKTRVLQGWYRETGDEVLHERANVYEARCLAWGLLSPESSTADAELATGRTRLSDKIQALDVW